MGSPFRLPAVPSFLASGRSLHFLNARVGESPPLPAQKSHPGECVPPFPRSQALRPGPFHAQEGEGEGETDAECKWKQRPVLSTAAHFKERKPYLYRGKGHGTLPYLAGRLPPLWLPGAAEQGISARDPMPGPKTQSAGDESTG